MTTTSTWQLTTPIDTILFDCDGTLSTIEGIDELARINGVDDSVQLLTAEAMGKSGLNPAIYQKRLDLVYPTQEQVLVLGHRYFAHLTPDASSVIQLFKRLNKIIYIISAGLFPAVRIFSEQLGIPPQNIFAVDIEFDLQGHYLDFDRTSPLINTNGKRGIVSHLKTLHPEMIYLGDGLNDYVTHDLVTRFIGYGGAYYRQNIESQCDFYIRTPSLTAMLPLSLTAEESKKLTASEQALYRLGLTAIQQNKVKA